MAPLSGQTIGKYHLQGSLGSGGMAEVYQAIQQPLERQVAFKVLHPHLMEQEVFRSRFLREAKAIAALKHPNIVQVYDAEHQAGICYIAMEFLEGLSLEEKLRKLAPQEDDGLTPLPLAEALAITTQVAEALDFAHQQGVVHRDVKPANIMLTGKDRAVLTDFGIATILHETRVTVEGGTSGTPAYMSPEQALGERGDERSDIYSLGAVLYQLVTGRLPFESDTLYGMIMKHINDTPPPATEVNPHLPISVEQVITKAMAKDPTDRYQTARALAVDLQAISAGERPSIQLPPQPRPERQTPVGFLRQHRVWLALALLLLVILGLARFVTGGVEPAPPTEAVHSMTAAADFYDDFTDNSTGWLVTDGPISRQLVDESYQVSIEMPATAIASYPENGSQYYDFIYEVEATLAAGQPETGYGLIFRRQDDENYYVFGINGLQQWSIWRLEDKNWHDLRDLPNNQAWTTDEAILPQGQVNRLKVEVTGPALYPFVNGQPLVEQPIIDTTFAAGGIGLYTASSRTAADAFAKIQFDNVIVTPLEEDTYVPSMTHE